MLDCRSIAGWAAALLLALPLHAAEPASAGTPTAGSGAPVLAPSSYDLTRRFALPPLADTPTTDVARQVAGLQVGRRAAALGLRAETARQAWQGSQALVDMARTRLAAESPRDLRPFKGERVSQLNALLRDPAIAGVRVVARRLIVDAPVVLARPGVWLDLGRAELRAGDRPPRFLARMENAPGATLQGGDWLAGQWGVLVHGSAGATVRGGRFDGLARGGVVVTDSAGVVVGGATFTRLGAAAILLHGETSGAAIVDNEMSRLAGPSNWNAGIVITDRRADVASDPDGLLRPDLYGVREQPIDSRRHVPRGNVLAFNRIAGNLASGVYSDGGIGNVFVHNLVEGNAKEGLCLDNGSTANVVALNVIRLNGRRWGMTDAVLKLDFVGDYGRLPDGTSRSKAPGVSIDNGLYNIVYANEIDHNQGGGIKLDRTAFFNTVALNVLTDNNEGANDRSHYFGIELGAATADAAVADLDFAPSRGNRVFGNTVRGTHYSGIFLGLGSTANDVFDNSIFGATHWSLEQPRAQANASLNNLSNLPSRNIGTGLDPALLKMAGGHYD